MSYFSPLVYVPCCQKEGVADSVNRPKEDGLVEEKHCVTLTALIMFLFLLCWAVYISAVGLCVGFFYSLILLVTKISWSCPILKGFRSISNECSLGFNSSRSWMWQAAVALGLWETRSYFISHRDPLQAVDNSGSKLVLGLQMWVWWLSDKELRGNTPKIALPVPH